MRTLTKITMSALVLLALAACGGESAEPSGESPPPPPETGADADAAAGGGSMASCIFAVEFRDATYAALTVQTAPTEGEPVGTGTIPPCADTVGVDAPETAEEVELVAIAGVSPDVAVALPGRSDVVLVRMGLEASLPPEIESLLEAP